MRLKKTVVSEGEELPVHRQNILNTRVVSDEGGEELEDYFDPETALEVWYVDNSRSDRQTLD
mgnify:CR=1 FL=1